MMLWLATVGVKQWRSRVPVARWMRCLSVLDAGEVDMTGRRGLLLALLKEALEWSLAAQLTQHLGYEKGPDQRGGRSKARNGITKKTVIAQVATVKIDGPRNRAGSFTPRLRTGQRCLDGLDSMMISLKHPRV